MNRIAKLILGVSAFVSIAAFTLPAYAASDLAVSGTGTINPAIIPVGYSFNVTIANKGPDTATGVKVTLDAQSGQGIPPTISASQGSCTQAYPYVCDLGALPARASANISVSWISGSNSLGVQVQGNEADPNLANNNMIIVAGGKNKPPKK